MDGRPGSAPRDWGALFDGGGGGDAGSGGGGGGGGGGGEGGSGGMGGGNKGEAIHSKIEMSQQEVDDGGGDGGNQSGETEPGGAGMMTYTGEVASEKSLIERDEVAAPVYIIIPALNEASALPITLHHLSKLSPRPAGIIVSDGGSTDGTPRLAESLGAMVVGSKRGRSVQMNTGAWKAMQLMQQVHEREEIPKQMQQKQQVQAMQEQRGEGSEGNVRHCVKDQSANLMNGNSASSSILCFVHADTLVPLDLVTLARRTLQDQSVCCGGFVPVVAVPGRVFWGMCLRNVAKTWYVPLLAPPRYAELLDADKAAHKSTSSSNGTIINSSTTSRGGSSSSSSSSTGIGTISGEVSGMGSSWFSGVAAFLRGMRMLYGDQAMFCRAQDFVGIGGFDERLAILEDSDLSERLHVDGWWRTMPISRDSLGFIGGSHGDDKLIMKRGGSKPAAASEVTFESTQKSHPPASLPFSHAGNLLEPPPFRVACAARLSQTVHPPPNPNLSLSPSPSSTPDPAAASRPLCRVCCIFSLNLSPRSFPLPWVFHTPACLPRCLQRAGVYLQQLPALQFAAFLCALLSTFRADSKVHPHSLLPFSSNCLQRAGVYLQQSPALSSPPSSARSFSQRAGVYLQQSPALQFAAFLCTLVFLWGITFALSPNRLP
ncbi:unnamed protein product [Closterium sp. NIES-64]|nr:unnamed protein product [Closterium sp. NIES-64]